MRKLKVVLFISSVFLCFSATAYAVWQIQFDAEADRVMHMGGDTLRGNFATKKPCQDYWKSRPAFERNHSKCVGHDKRTGTSPMGGYGSPEDFAVQMFGALLGDLFATALAPPKVDHAYQQQLALQKQQEALKQAAIKKQAMEEHKRLLAQEKARIARENAERKARGKDLLARMQVIDTGSPDLYAGMDRMGGGKLGPFGSVTPRLEVAPIGAGVFDTSGLTSWQRLLCSSYFSTKALEASRGGDPEGARHMNIQSDRVIAGEMTDVECRMPGLQHLADIQPQNFQQNNRMTAMVKLLPIVQEKVERLQQIELKLDEAREQKQEAQIRLEEAGKKVEEAKVQAESAQTPEKKDEADDLVAQALALQDEASTQFDKAEEGERKCAGLRAEKREELRGIQETMTAGSTNK